MNADPYALELDEITRSIRQDFAIGFGITDHRSHILVSSVADVGAIVAEPDPPRLIRVWVPKTDMPWDNRWRCRWIANDFRCGVHRTRAGALRAWKRSR